MTPSNEGNDRCKRCGEETNYKYDPDTNEEFFVCPKCRWITIA